MTIDDTKKLNVTDGRTDGPTDRQSGSQSRVHATKNEKGNKWKMSEWDKRGNMRETIVRKGKK